MKTKPISNKRVLKAWAVIVYRSKTLIYAEATKNPPQHAMYMGSGRIVVGSKAQIVPCTISYTLPTPKKGKKK